MSSIFNLIVCLHGHAVIMGTLMLIVKHLCGRFNFHEDLLERVNAPATVVSVLDHVQMQGEAGAQAVVDIPTSTLFS